MRKHTICANESTAPQKKNTAESLSQQNVKNCKWQTAGRTKTTAAQLLKLIIDKQGQGEQHSVAIMGKLLAFNAERFPTDPQ